MNLSVIILGLIEIVISFITGFFLFFFCFKLFLLFTKKIDSIGQLTGNNPAMGILLVGFIIGVMIIVRSTVSSTMDNLGLLFGQNSLSFVIVLNIIVRILLSYIFAGIVGFIIVWLSFLLFTVITRDIDELEEIKNSNTAIALILTTFMISAAYLAQTPVTTILNSIVAQPARIQSTVAGSLVNVTLLVEGILELPLWLLAVFFVFVIGYKAVAIVTREIDEEAEMKKNNIAVALLSSSFIFSIMLLINAALDPSYELLRGIMSAESITPALVVISLVKIVLFFVGTGILAFVMLQAALFFFMFLTKKINETEEIKKNNIAIGIVTALIVIALAFLIQHSMGVLLSGFAVFPGRQANLPVSL